MTAMNVYISGPMHGQPQRNFPAFFAAERELVHDHGVEAVFNPARHNPEGHAWDALRQEVKPNPRFNRRGALAVDLEWICRHANAMVMLEGWENSTGARAEKAAADALGIPVYIGVANFMKVPTEVEGIDAQI